MLKEWYYYFYQCTECRRCSVYCPYGIDTAEVTMAARELMNLIGLNINWIMEPVANCSRTGNHLGIQPHTYKDNVEFLCDELEDVTGLHIEPPINRKGAEVLFVIPSADYFADPGTYTFVGYLMLFEHIGLDYTLSSYASDGGNFGLFSGADNMKKLNWKIYHEAKRLGVKWILGGECGHMWRVMHQYMDTMNGPADFLEMPKSPFTGTVFNNAASTKMVHICEFTSDLIRNNKLKLDKSRNDRFRVTFHDSCNPARADGSARRTSLCPQRRMQQLRRHAGEHDPREHLLLRRRRRARQRRKHGDAACGAVCREAMPSSGCAITTTSTGFRASAPSTARPCRPWCEYWAPGVDVSGIHELVGNALIMDGENDRTTDLRGEPLVPEKEEHEDV